MSHWDAWHDGYSTGVLVAGYQVDIRWGRDPWLPLFVRYGHNQDFGTVRRLGGIGALVYGRRARAGSRRFRTRPTVQDFPWDPSAPMDFPPPGDPAMPTKAEFIEAAHLAEGDDVP